jgi:hypothetical protein
MEPKEVAKVDEVVGNARIRYSIYQDNTGFWGEGTAGSNELPFTTTTCSTPDEVKSAAKRCVEMTRKG